MIPQNRTYSILRKVCFLYMIPQNRTENFCKIILFISEQLRHIFSYDKIKKSYI